MLRNEIDKIRLLFRKDRESYLCFYRILGFYPRNIQLYEQALLHKSTSVRSDKGRPLNNERLEFLGDAILDAIVGDIVYKRFEGKREGFLTNTRSKIVQRETLNKLAVEIGLDKLIKYSTRSSSHNSYMYGNAFEAFIGAIYLDQGYERCKLFMEQRIINRYIDLDKISRKEVNFKSKLIEWSQKNMRYALCAFPLIGAVCGGLWCLVGVLPVPELVRAAGFCLVPVLVTGGIHLDGFADTCDALSSYGDAEKKLEILKDPHCGAFAVIRLCTYFILYFALCASVKFTVRFGVIWILALTLERAFSGLAVASFPMAKNTGLAHTFAEAADRITVRRVLIIYTVVLGAAMLVLGGWAAVLAALLVFWRYYAVSKKQFGGITGDLAGWFLQRAELAMLAALAVCQWGGVL